VKIVVFKETEIGETRVAVSPETVKKFITLGASVAVEAGAGLGASIPIRAGRLRRWDFPCTTPR